MTGGRSDGGTVGQWDGSTVGRSGCRAVRLCAESIRRPRNDGTDRLSDWLTGRRGDRPTVNPSDRRTVRPSDCPTVRLFILALATALPASAQTGTRLWRPEERVVLRDYSHVLQVAATNAGIFAVTSGGLTIFDFRFNEWLPPVTELDGFPPTDAVAAVGDPADESLWIGTPEGLVHYMPVLRQLERVAIPGGVQQLMFDRADPFRGLYVRTPREWMLVPRGSGMALPAFDLPPPGRQMLSATLEDVLRRHPAPDAMQAISLSRDGRQYRYTSAALDPMGRHAFFGTNGLGVLRYDGGVARLEPLPFGLLGDAVGALALSEGGVWTGTAPAAFWYGRQHAGFTWTGRDFQESRMQRGPGVVGYRFTAVRDMAAWQSDMWAATDAGVVRFDGGGDVVIDRGAGLPANDTYALATSSVGLWVGTARGIALVRDGGQVERPASESSIVSPITALVAVGDSVWAGGPSGLRLAASGQTGLTQTAEMVRQPLLRESVVALGHGAGHVVMATRDQILWRGDDGRWNPERPLGELGEITTLAPAPDGIWIGGRLGIQLFRFDSRSFFPVVGPGDLPGAVTDIESSEDFLWVGTERGLVRLRMDAVAP